MSSTQLNFFLQKYIILYFYETLNEHINHYVYKTSKICRWLLSLAARIKFSQYTCKLQPRKIYLVLEIAFVGMNQTKLITRMVKASD